jgi:YHS domain-containing protein
MKFKITNLVSAAALTFAVFAAPVAMAEDGHNHDHEKKEETKTKAYPLDTCIVSGDKLGEMGKPVVFEYKGQEIKLCCKDCRKDFDKDPAKYLKKMEENTKK